MDVRNRRFPSVTSLKGRMVRTAGRIRLRRDLHAVNMVVPEARPDEGSPVLYASNHTTWWDGFLVQRLHDMWRTGPLLTVVEEDHLFRYPALAAAGCVGVDRNSLGSLRTLLRTVGHRSRVTGMGVSLFPQGQIHSSRRRPLGFERGMDSLAQAMGRPIIVPVAIHAELFNRRRPTVFVVAGEPYVWQSSKGVHEADDRVAEILDVIQQDVDATGEFTPRGWEARMKSAVYGPAQAVGPRPAVDVPEQGASA